MAGEFTAAGRLLIKDLEKAVDRSAVVVMAEANYLVPRDTQTLVESGRIQQLVNDGTRISVTFGYGFGGAVNPKTGNPVDECAVSVHEIADAEHAPPTQYKFLETPVMAHAATLGAEWSAELRTTWGKAI